MLAPHTPPHPEEPRSGVSKDGRTLLRSQANSWFETALKKRLLTMRDGNHMALFGSFKKNGAISPQLPTSCPFKLDELLDEKFDPRRAILALSAAIEAVSNRAP